MGASATTLLPLVAVEGARPTDCSDMVGASDIEVRRELERVRALMLTAASELGGSDRAAAIASKVATAEAVGSRNLARDEASAFRARSKKRWEAAFASDMVEDGGNGAAVDELAQLRANIAGLLPPPITEALVLDTSAPATPVMASEDEGAVEELKRALHSDARVAAIVERVVLMLQSKRRARQAREAYGAMLLAKYEDEERAEEAERARQLQADLDALDEHEERAEEARRTIVRRASRTIASFDDLAAVTKRSERLLGSFIGGRPNALLRGRTAPGGLRGAMAGWNPEASSASPAVAAPSPESEEAASPVLLDATSAELTHVEARRRRESAKLEVAELRETLSADPRVAAIVTRVVLVLQSRRRARIARDEYAALLMAKYKAEEAAEEAERARQMQADLDALDRHASRMEQGRAQMVRGASAKAATLTRSNTSERTTS